MTLKLRILSYTGNAFDKTRKICSYRHLSSDVKPQVTSRATLFINTAKYSKNHVVNVNEGLLKRHSIILSKITSRHLTSQIQAQRPYVDPQYSYAFGRSSDCLIYSTVDREFQAQAKLRPDDPIFASYEEGIFKTYKEFRHDVNKLAKSLVCRFKITKGSSIGVYSYNCYNWLVAEFACSRIGAILTPINPSYKSQELAYVLEKGRVEVLLVQGPKSIEAKLNDHLSILKSPDIIKLTELEKIPLRHVIMMDETSDYANDPLLTEFNLKNCQLHTWQATQQNDGLIFESLTEAESAGHSKSSDLCVIDPDSVGSDDIFAVYYTSGTTGKPKGACVSHFTVLNNARSCSYRLRQGRQRNWRLTIACCLPMFHIFAGVLVALSPIVGVSNMVLASHRYDIKNLVNSMTTYGTNTVTVTPTMLIDLLTYIEVNKVTNLPLKVLQSGGAALPPEVVTRLFKTLPDLEELRVGYGSTENGAVSTLQTLHEPASTKASTVGSPMDFTEVRVVKPGTDIILPHGQKGEIQTRGYNTMIEYLREPEKTSEVITPTNWYRTGDMGFLHPSGSLQISGRMKEMIIKGGENIYPEEVRELLLKLDYIENAHVVGVPDKRFGEQVCAWIKLKPGYQEVKSIEDRKSDNEIHKDDILAHCKENITYFKVPKYLLFVDEFPMTPTKKAQAHVMTQMSIQLLGLKDQV